MRNALVGAVVGFAAAIVLAFVLLAPKAAVESVVRMDVEEPVERTEAPTRAPPPPPAVPPPTRGRSRPSDPQRAPFPPGTIVLKVGDAYVFGEDAVRDDEDGADLVCEDIHDWVGIATPNGSGEARLPVLLQGEPPSVDAAYGLLDTAPTRLDRDRLVLRSWPQQMRSGIGLVRAADGRVFKVRIESIEGSPRVLERVARLQYQGVEVEEGGGVVPVEGALLAVPVTTEEREVLPLLKDQPVIPGMGFTNFVDGTYVRVDGRLPPKLVAEKRAYLLLDEPLSTEIEFRGYSGLYARKGIAADGRVVIRSYTGTLVEGDMAGTIEVRSYSYLRIAGDLTGTVNVNSYASIVVEGDVVGKLVAGSYTTLLVKGRFLAPEKGLDCQGAGSSTFYFSRYTPEAELE
jgi:hypothetical protein